jgi:hypothetical protein
MPLINEEIQEHYDTIANLLQFWNFDFIYIPKSDIPVPWNEDFEFRHWSAGLKAKVHFRLHPLCSIGVEYAARCAWEKAFRHECDHQLTVKFQITRNLSFNK